MDPDGPSRSLTRRLSTRNPRADWGISYLFSAATVLVFTQVMADEPQPNVIHINTSQPGAKLSPMLFGGFLEHMFTCVEGGLWGELLVDRKFAGHVLNDRILPPPWEISFALPPGVAGVSPRGARLSLEAPRHGQIDGDRARSLRISVPHEKPMVVRITAPISVEAEETYRLTCWLRQENLNSRVRVWIESNLGETISRVRVIGEIGAQWTRQITPLTASASDRTAKFVFEFSGAGTLWLDSPSLMQEDRVSGSYDRQVLQAIRALQLGFLRWPGGNFAQTYHWRDGIGPYDDRPAKPNLAWKNWPEPNDFGTDEYLALCSALGAEPTICVNVDCNGATAQEAAAWVSYCNAPATTPWGRLRAANGHRQPYGVKYWELGNEIYGDWEVGHSDAATYARHVIEYAQAMRAVDPTIQLIAVAHDPQWNRTVLKECADFIDELAGHNYVNQDAFADLMAEPNQYERRIEETRAMIRELSPQHPIRLAVNEWNTMMRDPTQWQLRSALLGAGLLNVFTRQADFIGMACSSDLINGWTGGLIQRDGGRMFLTPLFYVEQTYRANLGDRLLPTTTICPKFKSSKFDAEVPVLDVVASIGENDAPLFLWVINKSEKDSIKAEVELTGAGFVPQRAQIWTLTADTPLAGNDFDHPSAVIPRPSYLLLDDKKFSYEFPKHSVVVMRLEP